MNEKIKSELDSLIKQINTIKYLHCVESKLQFDGDDSLYEDVLIDYQQNIISISELYNSFYTKAVAVLVLWLLNVLFSALTSDKLLPVPAITRTFSIIYILAIPYLMLVTAYLIGKAINYECNIEL